MRKGRGETTHSETGRSVNNIPMKIESIPRLFSMESSSPIAIAGRKEGIRFEFACY